MKLSALIEGLGRNQESAWQRQRKKPKQYDQRRRVTSLSAGAWRALNDMQTFPDYQGQLASLKGLLELEGKGLVVRTEIGAGKNPIWSITPKGSKLDLNQVERIDEGTEEPEVNREYFAHPNMNKLWTIPSEEIALGAIAYWEGQLAKTEHYKMRHNLEGRINTWKRALAKRRKLDRDRVKALATMVKPEGGVTEEAKPQDQRWWNKLVTAYALLDVAAESFQDLADSGEIEASFSDEKDGDRAAEGIHDMLSNVMDDMGRAFDTMDSRFGSLGDQAGYMRRKIRQSLGVK